VQDIEPGSRAGRQCHPEEKQAAKSEKAHAQS